MKSFSEPKQKSNRIAFLRYLNQFYTSNVALSKKLLLYLADNSHIMSNYVLVFEECPSTKEFTTFVINAIKILQYEEQSLLLTIATSNGSSNSATTRFMDQLIDLLSIKYSLMN